jgi:hypothetical protein
MSGEGWERPVTGYGQKADARPSQSVIACNAHWMFNPVSLFNIALTNAFLTRVRELSVSLEQGDGNGETVKMLVVSDATRICNPRAISFDSRLI